MDLNRMMKARQRIAEETDPVKLEMLERQLAEDMVREGNIAIRSDGPWMKAGR
jgi:hypothetical protein